MHSAMILQRVKYHLFGEIITHRRIYLDKMPEEMKTLDIIQGNMRVETINSINYEIRTIAIIPYHISELLL